MFSSENNHSTTFIQANLTKIGNRGGVVENRADRAQRARGKKDNRSQVGLVKTFDLVLQSLHGTLLQQDEKIDYYFSMLKREVVRRLYEIYRVDFEMFGYDASKYLS